MATDMPELLVRNTFLELAPEQLSIRRAHTTPAAGAGQAPERPCDDCAPAPGVTPLSEQSTAGDDEGFRSPRDPAPAAPPLLSLSRLRTGDSLHSLEESFHSPREDPAPGDPGSPEPAGAVPAGGAPPLGGLSVCVRNTFLDVRLPEPPAPLLRAATTPAAPPADADAGAGAGGEEPGPPPPAQLPLEQFVTDDRFEEPSELPAAAWARGAPAPPAAAPAPPPPSYAPAPVQPAGLLWPPPPPCAPPAVDLPREALPEVPQSDASLASICQPNKLTCAGGLCPGWSRVQWAVDARKLEGKDKQAVSPEFVIDLQGHGQASFRINIYPRHTNDGRGGSGFKKAKGHGRVELKCEAQLSDSVPDLFFHIGVGIGIKQQPLRGPVRVNLLEHPCCGLPKGSEDWDFASAVDETRTFLVFLEIAPPATASAVVGAGLAP